jgi:hypothetical protein
MKVKQANMSESPEYGSSLSWIRNTSGCPEDEMELVQCGKGNDASIEIRVYLVRLVSLHGRLDHQPLF